jgi:hypothetical protein
MMNTRFVLIAVAAGPFLAAAPPVQVPSINGMAPVTRAAFVERLERFYRRIDSEAHGYFTANDLVLPGYHIAHPPVPYFPAHLAQAAFRCVDANRDGKITHAEYMEYAVRAFDATARNGLMLEADLISVGRAISSDADCK